MSDKTIFLVRHAQPDFPEGVKLCLGPKVDLPLSDEGLDQARLLARFFAPLPVEKVFVSPLRRAQQTAQPIAGCRCPLVTLDLLTELDGGEWDGLSFDEIRQRSQTGMRGGCPPGGESDASGLERMLQALQIIDENTVRCAVAVAHGGVNRLLLCALSGRPSREKKQFAQDYAAVSILEKTNGVWRVAAVGLTSAQLNATKYRLTV